MSGIDRRLRLSDGAEMVYWVHGAAGERRRTALLLHGAASNHTRWSELVERTRLTDSWDLIVPDLRGNAASMVRGRLDLALWSRDLVELLGAERRDAALVIGHSLGAQIGLHFAHRHPDAALGLVLIDPVFSSALVGKQLRIYRMRPLFRLAVWLLRGLDALGLRRRIAPHRDLRELDEETRKALRGGDSHAEIARRYSALGPILRHQPTANYLQQVLATVAEPPPLEELHLPVLVILSQGSTLAAPEANRREIARFPEADTVAVEANHWPLTESPDEVREAIEEWVEGRFPADRPG